MDEQRLKFFVYNKAKIALSWSGQICFKVAYIYTDVNRTINSLETGLDSKMKINWYPSWLATCHALQSKLKVNTDRVSNKNTTSSPHTKQPNLFCPKVSPSSRFNGLLPVTTKEVTSNVLLIWNRMADKRTATNSVIHIPVKERRVNECKWPSVSLTFWRRIFF